MAISKLSLEGTHIDRFMDKVVSEDNCLVWTGAKFHYGHGVFRHKGKNLKASRVAYWNFVEPFDESLVICHKCDNPACVRGDHLFAGTQKDNVKDRDAKGRAGYQRHGIVPPVLKGNDHGNAILNEDLVREIRQQVGTCKELSTWYGVHQNTINLIHRGVSWRHVT